MASLRLHVIAKATKEPMLDWGQSVVAPAAITAATAALSASVTAITTTATFVATTVGAAEAAIAAPAGITVIAATVSTTAAVRTTAAATVAAATTAAATVTTPFTGWALLSGASFIDHHGASAQILAMHTRNGCLRLRIVAHFHKAKAFGATRVALHHHAGALHVPERRESGLQIIVAHRIRQIAYIQSITHLVLPINVWPQGLWTPNEPIKKATEF
jgi:hypothetical protein